MPLPYNSLEDQLLSHRQIDPITGCWLFIGSLTSAGYGQLVHLYEHYYAHRVSAHLYLGLDLKNSLEQANHKDAICPNKHCFNPDHLYVGSHSTNINDRYKIKPRKLKTHCVNGHEFTPENTRLNARGDRACRVCTRDATRKHRALSVHHEGELLINKEQDNQEKRIN